jgi:glycosyltransferase
MNKGIKMAAGEIIGILNADDIYAHDQVLAHVARILSNPDIDCCYGDLKYVDKENSNRVVRYWRSGKYLPRKFYWGWMPPHPTFFARKKFYDKFGSFNQKLGSSADYELMLRFLLKNKLKAEYIPEVMVHMRTGGRSNIFLKNRFVANRMDRQAWRVNDLTPYPWTIICKPLRKIPQFIFGSSWNIA